MRLVFKILLLWWLALSMIIDLLSSFIRYHTGEDVPLEIWVVRIIAALCVGFLYLGEKE